MSLHRLRNICCFSLPVLLLIAVALPHLPIDHELLPAIWRRNIYIITLTANIGYFTNFIAIKMLFKPHRPTAFGRQGLIPKNQPKLASALADTLTEHFLANQHWHDYLQQSGIIDSILVSLEQHCLFWLEQPSNQKQLLASIDRYLDGHQKSLQGFLEKLILQLIPKLTEKIDPEILLEQGFSWIEDQFENHPQAVEFLIEPIITAIAENVPRIAQRAMDTLDDHIENQDTLRRSVAKAARWSANIQQEDVKNYLFRMVASSEFRQTLLKGLLSLIDQYRQRGFDVTGNKISAQMQSALESLVHQQTSNFNPAQHISKLLQHASNQEMLFSTFQKNIPSVFIWLKLRLKKDDTRDFIATQFVKLIDKLDLKRTIKLKAANFSPAKMENIFRKMINEQLVFIELLGALLGALSGLALVDIKAFAIMAGMFAAYYAIDFAITRQRTSRSRTQLIPEK